MVNHKKTEINDSIAMKITENNYACNSTFLVTPISIHRFYFKKSVY